MTATTDSLWIAQPPLNDDGSQRISSVLIANRGEIACRVMATCRKLQIRTIAIYAQEDATSQHVLDADEAICLGSMQHASINPFLNIARLVETALAARADAIHPGYGYLSENASFAEAVRAAGIIFLGPSSSAINTLGDKRQAKEYLLKHEPSVPLIPGFIGSSPSGIKLEDLGRESEKIGFPVMIKASAGGGGKGLRIVHDREALEAEFSRAQSEAKRSFGLSDCILEKYIEAGKHIEVQIVGDSHGKVVSLWERDCSVQRRHQKVVEESPCPWLDHQKRQEICAVAVKIGELLRYEGAGTVEFIVDLATGDFYFLEVNARLQVEHPITEQCTGLDIVSLQLFVAAGGSLASQPRLSNITQTGHSIEVRLCAEDPRRDFAPQHGLVRHWDTPKNVSDVRFETAIRTGAQISIYFDSMIAKVVVWAPTRRLAIAKMVQVLSETVCIGPTTNQSFLKNCLLQRQFTSGDYTTSLIPNNLEELLANPSFPNSGPDQTLLGTIPGLLLKSLRSQNQPASLPRPFSGLRRGFRNQVFDRINNPIDIIAIYDGGTETNPQACLWALDDKQPISSSAVQIASLPTEATQVSPEMQGDASSASATKMYNRLSSSIRAGDLHNAPVHKVRIYDIKPQSNALGSDTFGQMYHVEAFLDKTKIQAYIATAQGLTTVTEPDSGNSLRAFCHFPALGYPIEYRCYSILSYFESQRAAISAAGGETSEGFIKAPMPCKVLQVLKKEHEEVKRGEVVIVIESMKMEITIAANRDGRFEPAVKEGDAVNEGAKLCTLT